MRALAESSEREVILSSKRLQTLQGQVDQLRSKLTDMGVMVDLKAAKVIYFSWSL